MEIAEKFISHLLEIHDCVIIPDFGGFVLNKSSARFSGNPNELMPSRKTASFNRSLNVNDGLLANHIAKEEFISYNEALSRIATTVEKWKNTLSNGDQLILKDIGSLLQNKDQKIAFTPESNSNYSRTSYGLPSLILSPIEKQNPQKVFILKGAQEEHSKKNPSIGRSLRAASIAAVFILGFFIVFKNISEKNLYTAKTNAVYKSIQPIASSIDRIISEETVKPAPTPVKDSSSLVETNTTVTNSRFYVVGGSFKIEANAKKFVQELKEKGFKAQMLDNEDGWFRVSYLTEQDSLKANKDLRTIKINENQSAWLLKF